MALTYRRSGVDIGGADRWLARMQPLIRSTFSAGVLRDRGQFAGLFRLQALRLRDPVLVASTDGVGTKLQVARLLGRHEGIGVDAVAMNVNDILVYGATPLLFLDYLAVGRMEPRVMSQLLRGVVRGCRDAGCALLGGETAEMPGSYGPGEYDIAGFCVGAVERSKLLTGRAVRAGDAVLGLASSGVHANGFSLVRRALTEAQLKRHGWALLAPTRIYVRPILRALSRYPVAALAHVTGGGVSRRIPSLVSQVKGLRVRLMPGSWPVPPVFGVIQRAGRISEAEMLRTFNMGIGMALVCRRQHVEGLLRLLRQAGERAWQIGRVESGRGSVSCAC